jgi:hypothetical protein
MTQAYLRLIAAPAENYHIQEEDRSGVVWLLARNFNIRFTATLTLQQKDISLRGVFMCVENAMLPVSNSEVTGYAHGIVSVYNEIQILVFSGPFLKPLVGMQWQDGSISNYWTEVVGSWAGERDFAGRLLQVNLRGAWQNINGQPHLVEEGDVTLI